MDIKERLRNLESLSQGKPKSVRPTPPEQTRRNIERIVPGAVISNRHGSYYRVEKVFPSDWQQGPVKLSDFLTLSPNLLRILTNQTELQGVNFEKTLFIDTETTGLSGGLGTCAFLIGVGYFQDGCFRVVQYFMNDFDEENALLQDLRHLAEAYDLLVTYNGKSFDIPLLNTRNVYQGIDSPFKTLAHFDLLHSIRRLWQHSLPDCSLITAESLLLGITREGDIPGALIPEKYFQYLRTKDAEPLQPILYHNQQDIVSMLALSVVALKRLEAPLQHCQSCEDMLAVGRTFERAKEIDDAIAAYLGYLDREKIVRNRRRLLMRLAALYKKKLHWESAVKAWEEALDCRFHPEPYIELAKYHEHRTKKLHLAKELVSKALSELENLLVISPSIGWQEMHADLLYRSERLSKKLTLKNKSAN